MAGCSACAPSGRELKLSVQLQCSTTVCVGFPLFYFLPVAKHLLYRWKRSVLQMGLSDWEQITEIKLCG